MRELGTGRESVVKQVCSQVTRVGSASGERVNKISIVRKTCR